MKRFNVTLSGLRILLLAGIALLLAACNGGGSSSTTSSTLSGTAAVGAPINGYVYVVDVNGTAVNTATNATTGAWTVSVSGMTAPFLVRVVPNGGGDTLYSYAGAADITVNITPLTHLAMYLAFDGDLDALYTSWAANHSQLTAQTIANAQAIINANFATQMDGEGLDHTNYDFFGDDFTADNTGLDALLDSLSISIDFTGGTYTILVGGIAFTLNEAIDTSGIDIGGSTGGNTGGGTTGGGGSGGSSSATINVTAATPSDGNGAITADTITEEDAGNITKPNQRRIRVDGHIGSEIVVVLVYYDSTTGVVENMSYYWGPGLSFTNFTFCFDTGTPCTGASVNLTSNTATFDVDLSNMNGVDVLVATTMAHLSGNVSF